MYDSNAVAPLTTWSPSGCANPILGGCPNPKFIDPTTNPANPGFYSTNLIRAMTGYAGLGNIIDFTQSYTNNYNSLQMQLNRRTGRIQWNLNYTFSRTIVYNNDNQTQIYQFVNAQLMKNVANRAHAVNFNFGYDFPDGSKLWSNGFTKAVLERLAPQRQRCHLLGQSVHGQLRSPPASRRNTGSARPPPTSRSAARWVAIST